jgi:hypothetical protein
VRFWTPLPIALLLLPVMIACGTARLNAQAVTGQVVAAEDGVPLQGAFVVLFDAAGTRQAAVITNSEGRYLLRATQAGRYTIQVERIGFETVRSPTLDVGAGTVEYRFTVPARAVALPAIAVATDSRGCARPEDGPAVQVLWDEVRKALDMTVWTQQAGAVRYTLQQHVRELDNRHAMLLSEARVHRVATSVHPFVAAEPAADLVRSGFVRRDGRDLILLGPDAQVLLSDEFLEGYCFSLVAGAGGEVGLGFEPVRRRRSGDVRGVLWVDRATAALRRLSYAYTGLPGDHAGHNAGGETHFRGLPNGLWIVDRWWIRSPLLQRARDAAASSQVGVREDGGTVLSARDARDVAGALYERHGTGVIEGSFHDRIHRAGHAGAVIHLTGTPYSAVVDAARRFTISGVPAGRYGIAFTDAWVQELGVPVALDSVVVQGDGVTRHDMMGPTRTDVLRALCPGQHEGDATSGDGLLYGFVTRPATGEPLAGVEVRAEWLHREQRYSRIGRTRVDGRYTLCWVPADRDLHVRITTRAYRTDPATVPVDMPFRRYDIQRPE